MSTAPIILDSERRTHLRVLTNSEIKTFRRCAREHHYAYRLGIRPVERAQPLRFGSLWHVMLERWMPSRDLDAALAVTADDVDPFDHAMARAMMRGYHARWESEPLETIHVEQQFRAALVNPQTGRVSRSFVMGGKIDALVVKDGRKWLVEHKSTSRSLEPGGLYWATLSVDPQPSTYVDGLRALGHEVDGAIYDVVRRPAIRPLEVNSRRKEAETSEAFEVRCMETLVEDPNRYFARATVVRLLNEEDEARDDRWQVAQAILLAERSGKYARNVDACERYGKLCPYFSACCGTDSLDNPGKWRRVRDVHEELVDGAP